VYLHSLPASSPEEFAEAVISLRRLVGLDAARGYVLSPSPLPPPFVAEGREERPARLCEGRPPLPAAAYWAQRRLPRAAASSTAPRGVTWLRPLGLFRVGREWQVATSCVARPPLAGWERVTLDAVYGMLAEHSRFFWRYWPRGLSLSGPGAMGVEEMVHALVVGGSAAGKTTFVKRLIDGQRFVAIDITPRGEYRGMAPEVQGSVDASALSPEERVQLLTIAFAATLGRQEASFTPVQLSVLRRLGDARLEDLPRRVMSLSDVPLLTRQVLYDKITSLCESVDEEGRCRPHQLASRRAEVRPPAVVRVEARDPFLLAFVVHGIVLELLKRPQEAPTLLVIDEYHRVASRVEGVEDPVEQLIRAGRHGGWHAVIATQSPLDLKRELVEIVPTFVTFSLYGEAARLAAAILGVRPEVVESLAAGEWLARTRAGPRRSPPRPS
jgi:hypothetical protein